MFVAKNRNGVDGWVYPCEIDWSRVSIKVLQQSDQTVGEIKEKSLADKKAELLRRYKSNKEGEQ